jgi:hypothetical protein
VQARKAQSQLERQEQLEALQELLQERIAHGMAWHGMAWHGIGRAAPCYAVLLLQEREAMVEELSQRLQDTRSPAARHLTGTTPSSSSSSSSTSSSSSSCCCCCSREHASRASQAASHTVGSRRDSFLDRFGLAGR